MSTEDGVRVDTHSQGYNLRYGRRIEYASPLVGRRGRARNPARNANSRASGNPAPDDNVKRAEQLWWRIKQVKG